MTNEALQGIIADSRITLVNRMREMLFNKPLSMPVTNNTIEVTQVAQWFDHIIKALENGHADFIFDGNDPMTHVSNNK